MAVWSQSSDFHRSPTIWLIPVGKILSLIASGILFGRVTATEIPAMFHYCNNSFMLL
jgi:hypothetical protein